MLSRTHALCSHPYTIGCAGLAFPMFVKPYYSRNTDHSVQNARRLESNAIVMASQTRDGTSISLALLARLCIRTAYAHFFCTSALRLTHRIHVHFAIILRSDSESIARSVNHPYPSQPLCIAIAFQPIHERALLISPSRDHHASESSSSDRTYSVNERKPRHGHVKFVSGA
jgi:hypothetical protein